MLKIYWAQIKLFNSQDDAREKLTKSTVKPTAALEQANALLEYFNFILTINQVIAWYGIQL